MRSRRMFGSLRAAPVPMGAAVLCVALGIGATTTVFSAVHAALIRPPPLPEPDRLVSVYRTTPFFRSGPFAPGNFLDLREPGAGLSGLAAMGWASGLLEDERGSARLGGWAVSGDFFPLLGVEALLGRVLQPTDEDPAAAPVVVVSEGLWRTRFGAAADVVGSTLRLDGEEHEVVGVLPAGFGFVNGSQRIVGDLWTPLRFSPEEASLRRSNYLMLLGRLAPGSSVETADAALRARMDGLVEAHPELVGEQLRVVGMQSEAASRVRTPLMAIIGAVVLVLLVASVDLAALLLVRGESRRREWAVRAALGAGRGDAAASAIRESLEVTVLGAILGLGLAWLGVRVVDRLLPGTLPQLDGMGLSPTVLVLGTGLAVGVGLLAAAVPAAQASRAQPGSILRSDSRGSAGGRRRNRLLATLVAAEVALSFTLLIGAGLLTRDFARLVGGDPGFDPESLLTLDVSVPPDRYGEGVTARRGFLEPALEAIRALPGVEDAGTISLVPYLNWGNNFNIRYEGQPGDDPATLPLTEQRLADNGYFAAFDLEPVEGRLFEPADEVPGAPRVAVANEALVARDFPGGSAVGRRYHQTDTTFVTIVGVVPNLRNAGPFNPPRPEVYYLPWPSVSSFPLVIETSGDPAALTAAVRAAILGVEPAAALGAARPLTRVMADSLGAPRFYMTLMALFAGTALVLALAGLYGLVSYVVTTRTREIGIRIALGSAPARTRGLVLRRGLALVGLGLALGVGVGIPFARGIAGTLHDLGPLDPAVWLVVPALFVAVATVALLVPAIRAQRVDPIRAMRVE